MVLSVLAKNHLCSKKPFFFFKSFPFFFKYFLLSLQKKKHFTISNGKNKKKVCEKTRKKKRKFMTSKIIPGLSLASLRRILMACRELNQIARITSMDYGLLIESVDTFNHTQLSCELKTINSSANNDALQKQTFINLETTVELCNLLNERKSCILLEFDNNTNVHIKDPNLTDIDLIPSLEFMEEIEKQYISSNLQQNVNLVSLLVADITNIFRNLCLVSGIVNVKLNSNGLLVFKNSCRVGNLTVEKQLKGFQTKQKSIELVDLNIIVKFVKVLIAVAGFSIASSCKKCTLELPSTQQTTQDQKRYLKIHFTMCSDVVGYFALAAVF